MRMLCQLALSPQAADCEQMPSWDKGKPMHPLPHFSSIPPLCTAKEMHALHTVFRDQSLCSSHPFISHGRCLDLLLRFWFHCAPHIPKMYVISHSPLIICEQPWAPRYKCLLIFSNNLNTDYSQAEPQFRTFDNLPQQESKLPARSQSKLLV